MASAKHKAHKAYWQAQMEDTESLKMREHCQTHWQAKYSIQSSLKPYWKVRSSLAACDDMLLYNSHIVASPSLRKDTMLKIHQGVERCRERESQIVYIMARGDKPRQTVCGEQCPIWYFTKKTQKL